MNGWGDGEPAWWLNLEAHPETTVRTRFLRARAQLREGLSRDMDFALEDAFAFAGTRCDRIVAHVLAAITPDGNPPPLP